MKEVIIKIRQHRVKRVFFFLISLFLLVSCASTKEHNILVIQSYEQDCMYYPYMNSLIEREFKKNNINPQINTFYLNCEEYVASEEIKRVYNLIDSLVLHKQLPELILVNDDQATYSLLSSKHPALKNIPIVFSGVNYPNWNLLANYDNVTGFYDKPDFKETMRMAETIFGNISVTYMGDKSFLGAAIENEFSDQLAGSNIALKKFTGEELNDKDIKKKGNSVSTPDSLTLQIFPLSLIYGDRFLWVLNGSASAYSHAYIIAKRDYSTAFPGVYSKLPIFSAINEGMGHKMGIMGAYVASIESEIAHAASASAKILSGINAKDLPVTLLKKEHFVDWNELKKWDIPMSKVPSNWNVVDIPFFEQYGVSFIVGATIVFILLIITILFMKSTLTKEIAKKKRVQEDLDWKQQVLALATESGNVFSWKLDLEEMTVSFNRIFFDYLNIVPQDYDLMTIKDIVHPDDYQEIKDDLFRYIKEDHDRHIFKVRIKFVGETYTWWEFRCTPVMLLGDKITKRILAGLCLDIHEYKAREQELIEARDAAAKAELKESFLANMSHEIRTPLNAIVGFSNILADDSDEYANEDKKLFVDTINTNCELLLRLINEIVDISRIESGHIPFTVSKVNVAKLLDEVYLTHKFQIPDGIIFEQDYADIRSIVINADSVRLVQALTNLLNNAIKFTKAGKIILGAYIDEVGKTNSTFAAKKLCIYVKDTGVGIDPKNQHLVFDRFYKDDEFAQGTGLGLSICRVIVGKHGGTINVRSNVGEGSYFYMHLPLLEEDTLLGNIEVKANNVTTKKGASKKKTILIAEDMESNFVLMKTILGREYDIVRAINGEGAIKVVRSRKDIDLIIMDVKMFGMNGIKATEIIKKEFPHIHIIIQTGYSAEFNRDIAMKAGCSVFLIKPIVPSVLKNAVHNVLS